MQTENQSPAHEHVQAQLNYLQTQEKESSKEGKKVKPFELCGWAKCRGTPAYPLLHLTHFTLQPCVLTQISTGIPSSLLIFWVSFQLSITNCHHPYHHILLWPLIKKYSNIQQKWLKNSLHETNCMSKTDIISACMFHGSCLWFLTYHLRSDVTKKMKELKYFCSENQECSCWTL